MFRSWREQASKLEQGEIGKEAYDRWRYKYPELDQSGRWVKVPSQALSDALIEELKKAKNCSDGKKKKGQPGLQKSG